jgi:hypothetical protein
MSSLVTLARACRDTLAGIAQSWSRFWFEDIPTTPLELARMGIGAALLLHYGLATPYPSIQTPGCRSISVRIGSIHSPIDLLLFHGALAVGSFMCCSCCCFAFMVDAACRG